MPMEEAPQEYQAPARGLLSLLPASWVPYGELMRLHKPGGYFAFYFPHLLGFCLGQALTPFSQSLSFEHQLLTHLCLIVGTLFLRGAACTWNDTLDAPLRPTGQTVLPATYCTQCSQSTCSCGVHGGSNYAGCLRGTGTAATRLLGPSGPTYCHPDCVSVIQTLH